MPAKRLSSFEIRIRDDAARALVDFMNDCGAVKATPTVAGLDAYLETHCLEIPDFARFRMEAVKQFKQITGEMKQLNIEPRP